MNHQPDEFDQVLNEALGSYSAAEPRPGIEQRVLRKVRTASAPRRSWWPWAAIAVPVLATLWLLSVNRAVPVQAPSEPTRVVAPAPRPMIARAVPPVARPKVMRRPVSHRREPFPRPVPLSPEERALAALVTRFPDQARELAVTPEPRPIERLEIPELEIPPLAGDIPQ